MITRETLNAMAELQKELNERGEQIFSILITDPKANLISVRYHSGTNKYIEMEFMLTLNMGDMCNHITCCEEDFIADNYIERAHVRAAKLRGKLYIVVAGRYDQTDEGVEENFKTCHTGLDEESAKKLYHECRGYAFSRIEVDGVPGIDVSDVLFGV